MCFFYLLHQIIPTWNENYGKRNCQVFLFGMVIYCASFIILMNLMLGSCISKLQYDGLFYVGFILFVADACVMAYEYKYFFGRSITYEVGELGKDNDDKWNYDKSTHTYVKNENDEKNKIKIPTNEFDELDTIGSNKSVKSVKSVKSKKSVKSEKK